MTAKRNGMRERTAVRNEITGAQPARHEVRTITNSSLAVGTQVPPIWKLNGLYKRVGGFVANLFSW